MDPTIALLSEITSRSKYQMFLPDKNRKETWNETVDRNKQMHLLKYASLLAKEPALRVEIDKAYSLVQDRKILPSMRSMQFAGPAVHKQEARVYNCCYLPISDKLAFKELVYLLLCGTGVGYSVQFHHVNELPQVCLPNENTSYNYQIQDSIEGWADAVGILIDSYFTIGGPEPIFDGSLIRPKGTIIKSVQLPAPGPESLLKSLNQVKEILHSVGKRALESRKLRPIEIMDMINILSECVLSGGIRRSSLICLFSPDDLEMMNAKSGNWWATHPWRARSNNSVVLYRGSPTLKQDFDLLWGVLSKEKTGEPGIYLTSDPELRVFTNPCVETALEPYQFCNLTEINAANIKDQEDFNERAKYAALIGTLQAGYTNFSYLSERWKKSTEADALLGIGLTGIANGFIYHLDEKEAAEIAVETNKKYADILGINSAARVTCVKPSGTTSLVLGCASGIHAIHSPYYIRRLRLNKIEPMYLALKEHLSALLEDDVSNTNNAVLSIPIRAHYENASYRTESPIVFLERVKRYAKGWILPGHKRGINRHNVSATVSVNDDEWGLVGEWLWENREHYNGISCFPAFNTYYKQAPFEECSELVFQQLYSHISDFDIETLQQSIKLEDEPDIDLSTTACGGGACEV